MFKSAIDKMAGTSSTVNHYNRLQFLYEMERLGSNPLELYLRWFSKNKLVYFDSKEGFLDFLCLLEDKGDIGLSTQAFLSTRYDTDYLGNLPTYFGKTNIEGNTKYLLVYPCTVMGDEISFGYIDDDCGVATIILDVTDFDGNNVKAVRYEWKDNGFVASKIL